MVDLRQTLRRPSRYVSVGAFCAVIHNVVMLAAYTLHIYYAVALVISFVIVTPSGYALHSIYTFERTFDRARFIRYTSGLMFGFAINLVIMFLLCSILAISMPIATLIATGSLFLFNYIAAHWAILLHRDSK